MSHQHFWNRFGFKDQLPGQKPIRNASQRIDVDSFVNRGASDRLRRNETGRTYDCAGLGEMWAVLGQSASRADEPEVENLDDVVLQAATREQDVGRFEIAVDERVMMSLG